MDININNERRDKQLIFPASDSSKLVREAHTSRFKLTVADDIVMCNNRVVVPKEMQQAVLEELHAAHQGQERAMQRARQTVYWPGMTNDVRNVVKACKECQVYQPSQQREPLLQDSQRTWPGEAITVDFFSCEGREYLVITDKYSGWLEIYDFTRGVSTEDTVLRLLAWSTTIGAPNKLRSDYGPQFKSEELGVLQELGLRARSVVALPPRGKRLRGGGGQVNEKSGEEDLPVQDGEERTLLQGAPGVQEHSKER